MTMYRTQTANVLNEADDFGRRLDYQLFLADQEAMLYGDPDGWKPGDPLYPDPRTWRACNCGSAFCPVPTPAEHSGYYGHHVRPMFELLEEPERSISWNRCKDCEVGWDNTTDFWICGEKAANRGLRRFSPVDEGFEAAPRPPTIHFDVPPVDNAYWERFRTLMTQAVARTEVMSQAFSRAATQISGLYEYTIPTVVRSTVRPGVREIECPEIPEYEPTDYDHLFAERAPFLFYRLAWKREDYATWPREAPKPPEMIIREVVIPEHLHPDATPINQQRRRRR